MEPRIPIPKEEIRKFCEKNHITKLSLFGSVLRSDFNPDSDVDMLAEFETTAVIGLNFFGLESELNKLLHRNIDLNTPDSLHRYYAKKIIEEAFPIYVRT